VTNWITLTSLSVAVSSIRMASRDGIPTSFAARVALAVHDHPGLAGDQRHELLLFQALYDLAQLVFSKVLAPVFRVELQRSHRQHHHRHRLCRHGASS
jgi:hypothetical protein